MKFLLCFAALLGFCALAEVKTLPPIKQQTTINLSNKKQNLNPFKAIGTVQSKVNIAPITISDYQQQIMVQGQNWDAMLQKINKDIDNIESILRTKEGLKNSKYYNQNLTKLVFYRGVVNLHLENYGLAMIDMQYVIYQDRSYLTYKPLLYTMPDINLDQIMHAVWKFMYKLDEYFCNATINSNSCHNEINKCYQTSWFQNSCEYNIKYATPQYNNSTFIDIDTLMNYYYTNTPCTSCIFAMSVPQLRIISGTTDQCQIYKTDKQVQYLAQFKKFQKITSSGKQEVEDYLCRGFTNVMLLGENTGTSNAIYIGNAKSDIKAAILKNSTLPDTEQIKEISDDIVTAILEKYNQVVTKDMDAEQIALIQSAMTQSNLATLKDKLTDKYTEANIIAETEIDHSVMGNQTSNTAIDVNGEVGSINTIGYTQTPLPNVTNIGNIINNTTMDEGTQKQALLSTKRTTEVQARQTQQNLDTLLEMIDSLQSTGNF